MIFQTNMKFQGKASEFGGPTDIFMSPYEGLALYEHHEADKRPDLFFPRAQDLRLATNTRLNSNSYYIAVRYDLHIPRGILQQSKWKVTNLGTGNSLIACLVDYGPADWTDRVADLSHGLMRELVLGTDITPVIVESINI